MEKKNDDKQSGVKRSKGLSIAIGLLIALALVIMFFVWMNSVFSNLP